jgi:release factor glutamine methyltransferase
MVETALILARQGQITRICDVGTGSGAIAISLAVYLPNTDIYAVDLSPAALNIARENARLHDVTVHFHEGDLLSPLENEAKLDLITANLPYVTMAEIEELEIGVKDWEPRMALLAAGDGLDIYRRLVPQAYDLLQSGGFLLCEVDPRQVEAAHAMMQDFGEIEVIKDGAGRGRLVKARRMT